ncbi:MAG: TonB-dependent receptor [Alphaproteobacteria bacterium]|nr:TonB-dependent receptor [Alphaproteobacteria bacterium]
MARWAFSAAAALAVSAGGAQAQTVGEDDIIVTAQRREQNIQDVGLAVTTLSGAQLVEQGVATINGLENIAPSLDAENQFGFGQVSFTLRGVGFKDYATNNAPTVGVYIDEVAYTAPVMTQGLLFDVARVEVLRGPQGTLYGRNTTGGAINVISARPTESFEWGGYGELGSYGLFKGEAYVSGPLSDRVRGRVALATTQGGAWQTNRETGVDLGNQDRGAARAQVNVDATDALSLLFNAHYVRDESDGLGLRLFKSTPAGAAHAGRRDASWGASPEFAAIVGIAPDEKPFRDNDGYGGSLTARYDFGAADLTYIASRETFDRREYADFDAVPQGVAGVYFTSDITVTQHEARLASTGDQRFDWIAGLYYAEEELDELYQSDFVDSFGPGFAVRTPYRQEVETKSIFAQAEFQATPRLNLIAGARYEDEQRDLIGLGTFASGFGPLNFANGTVDGTLENRSTDMQEWSGRLAAEYAFTSDALGYVSISRGVKSGGFTAYNTLNPQGVDPFDPEILIAYEAGAKTEWFGGALRANGALYYYDYTDQQVQGAIFDAGLNAIVGKIINAPESEIYGAELELFWRPIEAISVQQTFGYAHGEFQEFDLLNTAAPPATIDLSGERIGFPEFTYSGVVSYDGVLRNGLNWRGALDYSYRGDTDPPLLRPVSGEGYGVDSYWLVNATLSLASDARGWEAALWARNLLDEEVEETRNFFAGADFTPVSAPGLPRMIGVRLSLRQ